MLVVLVLLLIGGALSGQVLEVSPSKLEIPGCLLFQGFDNVPELDILVKSSSGAVPFAAIVNSQSWLRVSPQFAVATTRGVPLKLTINKDRVGQGMQRTYLVLAPTGSLATYSYTVKVDCVPTPTLNVPIDVLPLNAVENGSLVQSGFPVVSTAPLGGPTDKAVTFRIETETPGSQVKWLVEVSQSGQPAGQGFIKDAVTGAFVSVKASPLLLQPGKYTGYVHISDTSRNGAWSLGTDTLEVELTVTPAPGKLNVVATLLPFTSDSISVRPPGRVINVLSVGPALTFTARPVTDSGGDWLLLNGGTTPVTLSTPTDLQVSVALRPLSPGTYKGKVVIEPAVGSKVEVPVELTVTGIVAAGPEVNPGGIVDTATGRPVLGLGSWASLYGLRLAPDTPGSGRTWGTSDFSGNRLPLSLDGVSVTIGGRPSAVQYVSNTQINVQVPTDSPLGDNVPVVVTTSKGISQSRQVTVREHAPGFFPYNASRYVAAQHANYAPVGPPGLLANTTPAKPGEVIIIYCAGLGPTNPPHVSGVIIATAARTTTPFSVFIGGVQAEAQGFLIGAGLYQINVTVPPGLPDQEHLIVLTMAGRQSQDGATLVVRR